MAFNIKRLIEAKQNRDTINLKEYNKAKNVAWIKFADDILSKNYDSDLEKLLKQCINNYQNDNIYATLFVGIFHDDNFEEADRCNIGIHFMIHESTGINSSAYVMIARADTHFKHYKVVVNKETDIKDLVNNALDEINELGKRLNLQFNQLSEDYTNGYLYLDSTGNDVCEIKFKVEILNR